MEIKINLLEAASEIAHNQLVEEEFNSANYEQKQHAEESLLTLDGETTIYTEEAQDRFNTLYDEWFNRLLTYKI